MCVCSERYRLLAVSVAKLETAMELEALASAPMSLAMAVTLPGSPSASMGDAASLATCAAVAEPVLVSAARSFAKSAALVLLGMPSSRATSVAADCALTHRNMASIVDCGQRAEAAELYGWIVVLRVTLTV